MDERPMSVADLGEFGLIDRIARRIGAPGAGVVVGIGDDVAVLETEPDRLTLVSCDAQVEGTHFERGTPAAENLGRKAVAINLSDIAAAAGRPSHLVVSLVLPPTTPVAFVDSLYAGMVAEAAHYGAGIVGGNISSGERVVIDLTVLGWVRREELLQRSGASPGDRLLVTGTLGAAAAGLWLTKNAAPGVAEAMRERALAAFETPTPRLREAGAIAKTRGATAMLDISDGLSADLTHLCQSSAVGARLRADAIPIDPAAAEIGRLAGLAPLDLALSGGEDYELLLAAEPGKVEAIESAVRQATGTLVTEIGWVVPETDGVRMVDGPQELELPPRGWRHF